MLYKSIQLVQLVDLRCYTDILAVKPYRGYEAGDNQSLKS